MPGLRLRRRPSCRVHPRRFLAWMAISAMAAQACRILAAEDHGKSREGREECAPSAPAAVAGAEGLGASGRVGCCRLRAAHCRSYADEQCGLVGCHEKTRLNAAAT